MDPSKYALIVAVLCADHGSLPALGAAPSRPPEAAFRSADASRSPQTGVSDDSHKATDVTRETRIVAGWTVHISRKLLEQEPKAVARALELLERQLVEIGRVVPPSAVTELRKVRLYLSTEYPGVKPRAEFHPGGDWLRRNGRDPAMAKGIEFTNIRIFEQEMNRMPNFALHELAHAYHDRVLPEGFANREVVAAFENAKAGGKYDRVEHWHGNGKSNTFDRAYAMTNPMEYFAETSEAFFSRNDFFPFTRAELKQHDPVMFALLEALWNRGSGPAARQAAQLPPTSHTGSPGFCPVIFDWLPVDETKFAEAPGLAIPKGPHALERLCLRSQSLPQLPAGFCPSGG